MGSSPVAVTYTWDFALALTKKFPHIEATIECGFTLKRVSDMIRTCGKMHPTDNYWEHSSIIRLVWLNVWVYVYELSDCGFKFRCIHLKFGFRSCLDQWVSWHSANYRVWIHSETRTWQYKNIQSNALYRYVITTESHPLASLTKWLSFRLWTKWSWFRVQLQSLKVQISRLFQVRRFFGIQATIECGFTLIIVSDMIKTQSNAQYR